MTRSRCERSASKNSRRARRKPPAAPGGRKDPRRTHQAHSMLRCLDAELARGMILNGRKLMRGPTGKHWIAWLTVRCPLIGRIR